MANTTNLNLPLIEASQAQKHVTHNEAIAALDALTQSSIIDRDLATPPSSPNEGDTYIVGPSPTGDWSGHAGKITTYYDSVWRFYTPKTGWLAYINDEGIHVRYNGSAWVSAFTQSGATWGWQDWANSGSAQSLTQNVYTALENDGLGAQTNTSYKVPEHGNIWNTTTNQLDFTDLSVGDEISIRFDIEIVTNGSNSEFFLRGQFGSTFPFTLGLGNYFYKGAGTHHLVTQKSFYIGSTDVRDSAGTIEIMSDTGGETARVAGFYIRTMVR